MKANETSAVILHNSISERQSLKEYYEIVDEARPLSGLFPTHMLIFIQECIYNHETKQASKFQSDPSSNCFKVDV